MSVEGHGDAKYRTGQLLRAAADWPELRVELWRHEAGALADLTLECNEVAILLSGQTGVKRTGDGQRQEAFARPGTSWICPAGTYESNIEVAATMGECLHIYLPPTLLERSALHDHEIDPARVRLAYAGGLADNMMMQIGTAFRSLLDRGAEPMDRLFVDGMRTALAAHLLGNYTRDLWLPAAKAPSMDARRLKRVTDFIEARLSSELSLDDLAAEACLSPFHFARQFRDATGMTPHRYVTDRRIQAAKEKLALGHSSLVEIAFDTGFGSQANFNRVFRKVTGLTPGQFRALGER